MIPVRPNRALDASRYGLDRQDDFIVRETAAGDGRVFGRFLTDGRHMDAICGCQNGFDCSACVRGGSRGSRAGREAQRRRNTRIADRQYCYTGSISV